MKETEMDFATKQVRIKDRETISNIIPFWNERGFNMSLNDVVSESRKMEYCLMRVILARYIRYRLKWSFQRIGEAMGDRDHATILNMFKYKCKGGLMCHQFLKAMRLIYDEQIPVDAMFDDAKLHQFVAEQR